VPQRDALAHAGRQEVVRSFREDPYY